LEEYSKNYVSFKRRIADNTLDFVDERLRLLSSELNDVEKDLEKFKTTQGVINLSTEGEIFLNQVSNYDKEVAEVDVQLQVLADLKRYITRRNNESIPIPATLGLDDQILQSLLTQLFEAEFEYEKLSKTSGAKNPNIEVLKDQIQRLKPSIVESIYNLERSLREKKNNLRSTMQIRENALRQLPQKERMLLDISRQQSIKNTIYTFLLQKREEAAIQAASIVPNYRIINLPDVVGIESPRTSIAYVLSWGLSVITFSLIVFLLEFANSRFLYKKDIEEIVDFPIVGELLQINEDEKQDGVVVKADKRDVINEQFRELRTNISFLNRSIGSQSIIITSSKSGEGKSFVSVNLAISLATSGKRVVVVELDLRKPKVLQYLSIPRGNGISNYVMGSLEIKDIIQRVSSVENLFVIGAGPIPPNPAELLLSERIDSLFKHLRANFEYIILDVPPVGIVADARILGKYADTCLYIVRSNFTEKSFGELIADLPEKGGLPSINLVFNGVKFKRSGYYGQGYGYGYTNAYGYLSDQKNKSWLMKIKDTFSKK
jgi:capsular exopolysaccharide synthesis family protein